MSDEPKIIGVSSFREPLSPGNGNGHKPHFRPPDDLCHQDERKVYLKYASFYLAVAFLLILSGVLGRIGERPDSNVGRTPLQDVHLVLHTGASNENRDGSVVWFRLSNMGNHPVFYPVRPDTNVPIGQIVVRNSHSSVWTNVSDSPEEAALAFVESNLTWIEMPPGGWVDGEFRDPGESAGEHAYAIFLKSDRNGEVARIVSEPYRTRQP